MYQNLSLRYARVILEIVIDFIFNNIDKIRRGSSQKKDELNLKFDLFFLCIIAV